VQMSKFRHKQTKKPLKVLYYFTPLKNVRQAQYINFDRVFF